MKARKFVHAQLVSLPFEHEKVIAVSKATFLKKQNGSGTKVKAAGSDKKSNSI